MGGILLVVIGDRLDVMLAGLKGLLENFFEDRLLFGDMLMEGFK
jgi:hypothetical protein